MQAFGVQISPRSPWRKWNCWCLWGRAQSSRGSPTSAQKGCGTSPQQPEQLPWCWVTICTWALSAQRLGPAMPYIHCAPLGWTCMSLAVPNAYRKLSTACSSAFCQGSHYFCCSRSYMALEHHRELKGDIFSS